MCAAMIDSFWQSAHRQCHNSKTFYAIAMEDSKELGKVSKSAYNQFYSVIVSIYVKLFEHSKSTDFNLYKFR